MLYLYYTNRLDKEFTSLFEFDGLKAILFLNSES